MNPTWLEQVLRISYPAVQQLPPGTILRSRYRCTGATAPRRYCRTLLLLLQLWIQFSVVDLLAQRIKHKNLCLFWGARCRRLGTTRPSAPASTRQHTQEHHQKWLCASTPTAAALCPAAAEQEAHQRSLSFLAGLWVATLILLCVVPTTPTGRRYATRVLLFRSNHEPC